MKLKPIIKSWDVWTAVALAGASARLLRGHIDVDAERAFYSLGIAVLSTIFSVFFAALAIIMSSSDDDFIDFLEEEQGYSSIIATFRFTLIVLFIALICSVFCYVYTYVRIESGAKSQSRALLVLFEFLFFYGLFAALASALDSISYARYRSRFLSARKALRKDEQDSNSKALKEEPAMTQHKNGDKQHDCERDKNRFTTASDVRKFEISLFWTRSLFFWGFIAAAFVAVAALKNEQPTLALLISEFGVICSLAWTLGNRGSKYWQEQWESKIEQVEDRVTGPLFKREEEPKTDGAWLRGRRYSVSRLAISVSDTVLLLWASIYIRQIYICLNYGTPAHLSKFSIWAISAPVIPLAVAIAWCGRSTPREKPRRG